MKCPHLARRELSAPRAVERLLNMNAPSTLYGRFLAVTPEVIYVRAVRDRDALAMYLLHEARHAWQHANRKFPQGTREEFEAWREAGDADATAYERRAYQKVFSLIRQYDEAE